LLGLPKTTLRSPNGVRIWTPAAGSRESFVKCLRFHGTSPLRGKSDISDKSALSY